MSIITSLLQNDLYKFSMLQGILHNFPEIDRVEYAFKCRTPGINLIDLKNEIWEEIDQLCSLSFKPEELAYLSSIPWYKPDFIDYLENYRLRKKHIYIGEKDNELDVRVRGSLLNTMFFEIPLLTIINNVYFRNLVKEASLENALTTGKEKLKNKISIVKKYNKDRQNIGTAPFLFADFGLRRCFSVDWHDEIVVTLKKELPDNFIGTSNVYLAKKHDVKPIGTMAHEWLMIGQALPNVRLSKSQSYMLETWVKEYRGSLGIALTDTLGFDFFLKDFDLFFAKLYDGGRHDSGDPYTWCEKFIKHYENLKIDPTTKSAIFSDNLTIPIAIELTKTFGNRIKVSHGIGTNLTNDCGFEPLNIVIKPVMINGNPVAKISDSVGKCMCEDDSYITYLKYVIQKIK
jgi:nicotinate phosphoribosyltransferase